ncbi:MAG: glycosyltransferase [Vulcanibacillus sp.]
MKKKYKVLQVFGSLNLGGAESRMIDVYENINKDLYEFSFLSMSFQNQYYENKIESFGAKLYKVISPRESLLKNILQINVILKQNNFNAIHCHVSYYSGILMFLSYLHKIPVRIVHARTTGSENNRIIDRLLLFFGKQLVKHFSTSRVAISNSAGKFLFGKMKFDVIPNAINYKKFFNTEESEVVKIKKSLNISNELVIGHVGRFEKMKNHDFLLRIALSMKNKGIIFKMILIGEGTEKEEVRHKIQTNDLNEHVLLINNQSNINVYMRVFDIFVFPSKYEGLGSVVLEAQASGCPCLLSTGVPKEVSLGLGNIDFLDLTENIDKWIDSIKRLTLIKRPTNFDIEKAFQTHGLTLENTVRKIENLFETRGEK